MKKIFQKRILLTLSGLTAITIPVAAVVSCGSDNGSSSFSESWLGNKRNLRTLVEQQGGKQPYVSSGSYQYIPRSVSAGALMSESFNSYYVAGLREEIVNFPQYDKKGNLLSGKVSESFLRFDLFDQIKVTFRDNTSTTFTSDSNDTSDNTNINGDAFKSAIAKDDVQSIKFHLKDNQYWTKNETGSKSYKVTLDDYIAGVNYDKYLNSKSRNNNEAGKNLIDQYYNKNFKLTLSPAKASDAISGFDGGYMATYGLMTSNVNDMVDRSTNEVVLKFASGTSGLKVTSLFEDGFYGAGGIVSLQPSQLFQVSKTDITTELAESVKKGIDSVEDSNLTADELKVKNGTTDVKDYIMSVPAFENGFYNYLSQNWKEFRSAGQYYLQRVSDNSVVFKQNPNYSDKDWLADETTLLSMSYEFIDSAGDTAATILKSYEQGTNAYATIDAKLPDKTRASINNDVAGYGVRFSKGRTSRGQVDRRWTRYNYLPIPSNDIQRKNFYFNDGYAKVMFGANLKQLAGVESATGTPLADGSWVQRAVNGVGAEFRSSLYAAINWYSASTDYSQSRSQEWTSRFAPEQTLGTANDRHFPINSKKVYSTYALYAGVDTNNSKLAVTSFTHEEKVNIASNINSNRYVAAGQDLLEIKRNVKHALDNAGLDQGEKVIFELPIDYTTWTKDMRVSLEKVRLAIQSLDSRIQVAAAMTAIDPTSSTAKTDGSESVVEDYQKSYMPDKEGWTLKGLNPASKDDLVKSYIFPRLESAKTGVPAFGLNSGYNFTSDTLTQVFDNFGYLQDGTWGAVAYYARNKNKLPQEFTQFGTVSELYATTLSQKITSISALDISKGLNGVPATDPDVVEAANAIKDFDVYGITSSDAFELTKYDYFGIKGSLNWETYRAKVNLLTRTTKQDIIKNYISSLIGTAFKETNFNVRQEFKKYTVEQKEEFMTGFDTIIGGSWFFNQSSISNRTNLPASLQKKWLKRNSNVSHYSRLGSFRIVE